MIKMQVLWKHIGGGLKPESWGQERGCVRKENKEQQTSTIGWENDERLNTQVDNNQTIYKKRTLIHNLQQAAQAVKILFIVTSPRSPKTTPRATVPRQPGLG